MSLNEELEKYNLALMNAKKKEIPIGIDEFEENKQESIPDSTNNELVNGYYNHLSQKEEQMNIPTRIDPIVETKFSYADDGNGYVNTLSSTEKALRTNPGSNINTTIPMQDELANRETQEINSILDTNMKSIDMEEGKKGLPAVMSKQDEINIGLQLLQKDTVYSLLNQYYEPDFYKINSRKPDTTDTTFESLGVKSNLDLKEDQGRAIVPYVGYDFDRVPDAIYNNRVNVEFKDGPFSFLLGKTAKVKIDDRYTQKDTPKENGTNIVEDEGGGAFIFYNNKANPEQSRKKYVTEWKQENEEFANNKFGDKYSVGFIYVLPIDSLDSSTGREKIAIPFQFNPEISEGSYQARYNAITILSRIGELQSYTGSNLSSLEISSRYEVLAREGSTENSSSYMSMYTPSYIRKIENLYRSLVLPYRGEIDGVSTYVRPPMIKVVLGDMFTHPVETDLKYDGGIPELEGKRKKITSVGGLTDSYSLDDGIFKQKFRTYVATSVTIRKNLQEDKIIIMNNQLLNTAGFTVSLSLLEVNQNYGNNEMSDFETYYKEAIKTDTKQFSYGG